MSKSILNFAIVSGILSSLALADLLPPPTPQESSLVAPAEGLDMNKTAGVADAKLSEDEAKLFRKAANELRCPTCTGLSVLDSDAGFSVQIKNMVKEKIREGKSYDEILKFFTERYGVWILRRPPAEGFNAMVWFVPIGILVLGPFLLWIFVWSRRKVVVTDGVRPSSAILDEMEAELAALRGKGRA
jgi:cytochrome c-type biogenesis protein CcmH/NrfF